MVKRRLLLITLAAASAAAAPIRPSGAQIMRWRIATPAPDYPLEASARKVTGSGVFKIHFIAQTGTVRYVQVLQSTNDKSLDTAAVAAFRRWRFKSGVLPTMHQLAEKASKEPYADVDFVVVVPVTFTLGGASVGGGFGAPR